MEITNYDSELESGWKLTEIEWASRNVYVILHQEPNEAFFQEKGNAICVLRQSFPGNVPSLKIIPITEDEIQSTIQGDQKVSVHLLSVL